MEPISIQCPYCWETIEIMIDSGEPVAELIEDCPACCRPIVINLAPGEEPGVRSQDDC